MSRAPPARAARDELVLQLASFLDFAEAARDHLREAQRARCAAASSGGICAAGNRDERVVDRLRRVGEALVGRQAVDLASRCGWIG